MNDYIVVFYSPFSLKSTIYVANKNGQRSRYEADNQFTALAGIVAELAHNLNITTIKISAPLAIYNEVSSLIRESAQTQYNENNLSIEVI